MYKYLTSKFGNLTENKSYKLSELSSLTITAVTTFDIETDVYCINNTRNQGKKSLLQKGLFSLVFAKIAINSQTNLKSK